MGRAAGNVEVEQGFYDAQESDFSEPRPRCYDIRCKTESYEVWVSDLKGGMALLGICTEEGQLLGGLGLQGAVTCAPVEELCGVQRATHLGPLGGVAPSLSIARKVEMPHALVHGTVGADAGRPRHKLSFLLAAPAVVAAVVAALASLAVLAAASLVRWRWLLDPSHEGLTWSPLRSSLNEELCYDDVRQDEA